MTPSVSITGKGWQILKLFIIREGLAQKDFKYNPFRRDTPEYLLPSQHFMSYPRRVCFLLDHTVSVPTASDWCEKFYNMGLFKKETKRIESGGAFQETQHYFINPDLNTFKRILNIAIDHCSSYEMIGLFSEYYFQNRVNEVLVREILFEKGVKILTVVNLYDWSPEEAREIFQIWNDEPDQNETFQDVLQPYVHHFYEGNENAWDFSTSIRWSRLTCMQLAIPVFPLNIDVAEQIARMGGDPGPNPRIFDNQFPYLDHISFLRDHQRFGEYEYLILPILALIKISPHSCLYFLSQEWQGFTFSPEIFHGGQNKPSCNLLVSLFFLAMNDMVPKLLLPRNSVVSRVYFRDIPRELDPDGGFIKEDALMAVYLKNYSILYYDLGFATQSVEVLNIPSHQPSTDGNDFGKSVFWIESKLKRQCSLWYKISEIKDFVRLIALLQSDDPIGTRIRERFSNKMKNILSVYDKQKKPSVLFQKILLHELNNVLQCDDLYSKNVFSEIPLSETTRVSLMELLDEKNWVDDPFGLKSREVIFLGRQLLDDAFPEIFHRFDEWKPFFTDSMSENS
jgi:hypothetical protein